MKPGLQALFTLLDAKGNVLGEDLVDFRVCACPTRDAPIANNNSTCRSSNHRLSSMASGNSSSGRHGNLIRQKSKAPATGGH